MEAAKKVFDFLEKAGVFYLATVEGDQPRVMYYLKDAKADFFKMMELAETVTF